MNSEHQRPEGLLIDNARRALGMSGREAAQRSGLSDARWRQIINGYQSAGAGQVVNVTGPPETIARMAQAVDVTPDQLREAGRPDAADMLERMHVKPLSTAEAGDATRHLRSQLNRDLLRFTDYELLTEINARMLLMASRLHEVGDEVLTFVTDAEGNNVITSRPLDES